jgi:small subunit ribosomal protein S3
LSGIRRGRISKNSESHRSAQEKGAGLKLTLEEVRAPETHAAIAAQMVVEDLEKRVRFRRVLKQALDKISSSREVKGVKISLKGRLDGAEMARYEWGKKGRIPLHTLRADVDYADKTAYTSYGTIGVKVWIYKGDVFSENKK